MKFDLDAITDGANKLAQAAERLHEANTDFSHVQWTQNPFGTFPESATFLKSVSAYQQEVAKDISNISKGLSQASEKVHSDAHQIVALDQSFSGSTEV